MTEHYSPSTRVFVTTEDPLLKARDAAAHLSIGVSTFWRDVGSGVLPAPYYVRPKMPRWRLSELRAVIERRPRTSVVGGGRHDR